MQCKWDTKWMVNMWGPGPGGLPLLRLLRREITSWNRPPPHPTQGQPRRCNAHMKYEKRDADKTKSLGKCGNMSQNCKKVENIHFWGYALIITILHRGILSNLLQYYIGEGGDLSGPQICSTLQINGRPRDKYCIAHSHEVSALDLFFNLVWKWGRIWSGEKTKLLVRRWKSKSGFPQSRMRLLLSRALVLKARKLHNSFLAF